MPRVALGPLSGAMKAPPVWTRIRILMKSSASAAHDVSTATAVTAPSVWTHPSGLTVIHRSLRAAPVVAVQLWVGVGSAQENLEQLGMAHVHEHLVFKGTEKRGVGQIAADVEASGGSINAWTSLEETVYHVVMPADAGALGVDILLDGTLRTAFDEEELRKELEVIREEIRRGDDVPARSHMEHLFSTAWKNHPYGRPVIGTSESVSAFDSAALKAFHRTWYNPGNMRLVVVGDCSREDVEAWVDATLGDQKFEAFERPAWDAAFDRSTSAPVVEYREVENARVTLSFPGPSSADPDYPAMELLCMLLAGTNSSVLYDRLVRSDQLAVSAWSDVMTLNRDGLILAGATFAPETPARDVVRVLAEELAGVSFRVREADLQRAKRSFESSHLLSGATVQGLANSYGSGALHLHDANWQARWMERLRAVSLEDIRRVARTWIDPEKVLIVTQLPLSEREKELRPSLLLDAFDDGFKKKKRKEKTRSAPDHQGYMQMTLENGMRLVVQPDRTLPIFSMSLGALSGALSDSDATAGRSTLMANLLTCGNAQRDTQALERELDQLGCNAAANSGQQTTVFSMRGLSEEQSASMELAEWCWFESDFSEKELARAKRVRLRGLVQQQENPGFLASRALREAFFEGHPYARSSRGTLATVEALTRADMLEAHAELLETSQLVMSVVGDVDVEALVDQVSGWRGGADATPSTTQLPLAPPWPVAREIIVEHQRKQAVVFLGYPGLGRDDADAPALTVLSTIMSGQGGRLFKALREERSMAYSVSMGYDAFADAGIVYGRIETSPDKVEDAVLGMREQLIRLYSDPLSEEEVARAKARLAGQTQVGLQLGATRAAVTLRDELLGRGYRYGLDFPDRIQAVNAKTIRTLAERLLRPEHEIVVVARPQSGDA